MTPEAVAFALFVAGLLLGAIGFYVCVHRPARREWAVAIVRLERTLELSRGDVEWAQRELATFRQQVADDAIMMEVAAAEIERLSGGNPLAVVVPIEAGRR